ncbi:hypothetical protein ABEB36_012619 [Hypothenemus hampei]|uniref:Adenylyltransferase and sulfurtransferase MOCS3 homolog n=1 Tax=Hypothenemus hampei TaxID=57062 RepID=A0ABD1ECI2_HYPHA
MLVTGIGLSGQIKLKSSKVLIVGSGGLGCPSAVYLAAAGVGEITLVDYDEVELSNLHRQILHTEDDLGEPKVQSAYDKLHCINRNIRIIPVNQLLDSNRMKLIMSKTKYDVVIDGSDNVATRYLLNDSCVLNGVPLVSGSALQTEAQLTVFNHQNGPCYRCLFPVPPPPETVTSCGDGGVLGPVPGVIGVLQALEAIKIIVGLNGLLSQRLLLFDGINSTFRNVKLRSRNPNCAVCGDNPTITDLIDYEQFCRASAHDKVGNIDIVDESSNVSVQELFKQLGKKIVIDVRPKVQFEMCHLTHTVNIPFDDIIKADGVLKIQQLINNITVQEVYVICRRGNDSQRTIRFLHDTHQDSMMDLKNVRGGLHAYSQYVDADFPVF